MHVVAVAAVYSVRDINKVDGFGYYERIFKRTRTAHIRNVFLHVFHADLQIFFHKYAVVSAAVVGDRGVVYVNDGYAIQIETAKVNFEFQIIAVVYYVAVFGGGIVTEAFALFKTNGAFACVNDVGRALAVVVVVFGVFGATYCRNRQSAGKGE